MNYHQIMVDNVWSGWKIVHDDCWRFKMIFRIADGGWRCISTISPHQLMAGPQSSVQLIPSWVHCCPVIFHPCAQPTLQVIVRCLLFTNIAYYIHLLIDIWFSAAVGFFCCHCIPWLLISIWSKSLCIFAYQCFGHSYGWLDPWLIANRCTYHWLSTIAGDNYS